MVNKRALSVCIITLLIVVGLATPGFAEKVLRIGTLGSDAISLDPHMSTKSQDKIIFPMIFNGLVRFKPGTADLNAIEPDLAESWGVSDDQLVWAFKLRRGVKFHGGYGELTADGVAATLAQAHSPSTSRARRSSRELGLSCARCAACRLTSKRTRPSS